MILEYAFRVYSTDNPVMRFTDRHPGHRVLITLLRRSTNEPEERAIYTFLGPTRETKRFLQDEFAKRHGTYEPISEDEDHVSVEVSTHLLPRIHGRPPNEVTYEVLGPDAVFLPFLVFKGWLHVRVLSANEGGGKRFLRFLDMVKEVMRPQEYQVVPVRPYRPELRLENALGVLTEHQLKVLKVANEMGYWDEPRRTNLEQVAQKFEVSKAAVHKSLATAERRVMRVFIEEVAATRGQQEKKPMAKDSL